MVKKYTCSNQVCWKENRSKKLEQVIVLFAYDPSTTGAERIQHIVESKYAPADLKEIIDQSKHLNQGEQKLLLKLIQKSEDLLQNWRLSLRSMEYWAYSARTERPQSKTIPCQTVSSSLLSKIEAKGGNSKTMQVWRFEKDKQVRMGMSSVHNFLTRWIT